MVSKQIVARQKSTEDVVAGIEAHREKMVAGLNALLGPEIKEGEVMPDVGLFLTLMGRSLSSVTDRLVASDQDHSREIAEDDAARKTLDGVVEVARQRLFKLRRLIQAHYDELKAVELGLGGQTADDPVTLSRDIKDVIRAMDSLEEPVDPIPGGGFDKEAWIMALKADHVAVDGAISTYTRERRETEGEMVKKGQLIIEHAKVFSASAGMAVQVLRLSGEHDLASRLRPSARRPGRTIARSKDAEDDIAETPVVAAASQDVPSDKDGEGALLQS